MRGPYIFVKESFSLTSFSLGSSFSHRPDLASRTSVVATFFLVAMKKGEKCEGRPPDIGRDFFEKWHKKTLQINIATQKM